MALLAGTGWPVGPARSQSPTAVDMQLVLAVDTSGSVNQERFELQRRGYAQAFRNPKVLKAILGGAGRGMAVTMIQWTGPELQADIVPWLLVDSEQVAAGLADRIEASERRLYGGGTSISGAIDYSVTLFPRSPFVSDRKVIDISGDGSNNRGRAVTEARDQAVAAGLRINGLPILALEPNLAEYYKSSVIGGAGAFMIPAATYEDFAEAIVQKLILEISDASPTVVDAPA
jgi:hypothetical protein